METGNNNNKVNSNNIGNIGYKVKKEPAILLAHGDGGIKTGELVEKIIRKYIKNDILDKFEDSAVLPPSNKRIAFTTDSYVIEPIFFPGGDIGKLSICGTVNDLATCGAVPRYLSFSLILEEGLPIHDLEKIMKSINETIKEVATGMVIVTGDTKVVNSGNADRIYINTAGIGIVDEAVELSYSRIEPGDMIIFTGTAGDHGIAILSRRKEFDFKTSLKSDCAPLNKLVDECLKCSGNIHAIRDATRGGLARIMIELAQSSRSDFLIYHNDIPVKKETRAICEFLGMDPLYIANEGKLAIFVAAQDAEKVLETINNNRYGNDARIIGKVLKKGSGTVILETEIGTRRHLDLHYSEQLPRIC